MPANQAPVSKRSTVVARRQVARPRSPTRPSSSVTRLAEHARRRRTPGVTPQARGRPARPRCRGRGCSGVAIRPAPPEPQQRDLAQVVDGLGALGLVVVAEPPLELGQDLRRRRGRRPGSGRPGRTAPRRRRVARREPRGDVGVARSTPACSRASGGVVPAAGALADPRVAAPAPGSSSSSVSVARRRVGARPASASAVGVRLAGQHVVGPARDARQAAAAGARLVVSRASKPSSQASTPSRLVAATCASIRP